MQTAYRSPTPTGGGARNERLHLSVEGPAWWRKVTVSSHHKPAPCPCAKELKDCDGRGAATPSWAPRMAERTGVRERDLGLAVNPPAESPPR